MASAAFSSVPHQQQRRPLTFPSVLLFFYGRHGLTWWVMVRTAEPSRRWPSNPGGVGVTPILTTHQHTSYNTEMFALPGEQIVGLECDEKTNFRLTPTFKLAILAELTRLLE